MSFIARPFRYAPVRIAVFSVIGTAIGLVALDWYYRSRPGCVLRASAAAHTTHYPDIPADGDFQPMVAAPMQHAITEFPVVSATEADEELYDYELVLGVTVGGESRAYPINTLTGPQREIINDTLGGRAIAATW